MKENEDFCQLQLEDNKREYPNGCRSHLCGKGALQAWNVTQLARAGESSVNVEQGWTFPGQLGTRSSPSSS